MKKKLSLFMVALVLASAPLRLAADEGMWLFMLLNKNYEDMKKRGLKLSPQDIYDINKASLKDAVAQIRGCSSEFISPEGLLLTNHHCAYDNIQEHSTTEHNYLDNGFWALSKDQELQATGQTASILQRMDDVTNRILEKAGDKKGAERTKAVQDEIKVITDEATKGSHFKARVSEMFNGNQYFLFIFETFTDVRLVGAPPQSIGKFGGDTDNWMWPRHTGDFSLLRVYMGKDGKPAPYSKDNIPYKPKRFFSISLKGYKEGDYAMVMGFPGRTQRYKTSFGIQLDHDKLNPARIDLRNTTLTTWKEEMDKSEAVRIQYSSKYAGIANYWKYFIGQNEGLDRLNTIAQKKAEEKKFMEWVNSNPERKAKYGNVLADIESATNELAKNTLFATYFNEIAQECEVIGYGFGFRDLNEALNAATPDEAKISDITAKLKIAAEDHFKDYFPALDERVMAKLMQKFVKNTPTDLMPEEISKINTDFNGNWEKASKSIFENTIFANKEKMMAFLNNPKSGVLSNDPVYKIVTSTFGTLVAKIQPANAAPNAKLGEATRLYVSGLMEQSSNRFFYPDANSTPRLSYGRVQSYSPKDATKYTYFTTLEGIKEKDKANDPEFDVPQSLRAFYNTKDFGRYGVDGTLPVAFITDNDITGGNSGSPVLNAKGELIGTAYDGNWEAMTGDLVFDQKLKRCINADVRYTLFIIEKLGKATNLINEMKIVE